MGFKRVETHFWRAVARISRGMRRREKQAPKDREAVKGEFRSTN